MASASKTAARAGAAADDVATRPDNSDAESAVLGIARVTAPVDEAQVAPKPPALQAPPPPTPVQDPELGAGLAPSMPTDVAAVRRSDIWWVIDTTAKEGPRTHEPLVGVKYHLDANRWTAMPSAHAMVFLPDPAFMAAAAPHTNI